MPSKFNMKSCFFAFIVLNVAIVRNFVRAEDAKNPNTYEIENPQDFTDKVLKSKEPVITQFHAPWCGPCKVLTPSLQKAVSAHEGKVKLARVDVAPDDLGNVARQQGIRSVPIVSVYKAGKCVDQMIGLQSDKTIREFVQKQLD